VKYESLTLVEFQDRFRTEEDCLNHIAKMRWPQGFVCAKCGFAGKCYKVRAGRVIQCGGCRHQTSITAGTIFHRSRLPLVYWFWMIYLVAEDKGGASASRISKQLGIRNETIWINLQKIRSAMRNRDDQYSLAGFIELDEAFFGRAATAKKPDKGDNQAEVIVMIEAPNGIPQHLAMQVVDVTSRQAIQDFVVPKVKPGQSFKTDAAQYHWVLKSLGHSLEAKVTPAFEAHIELPWVHKAISLAKRFILGTYHGVSAKHLQRYLDEFCFRFNRRHRPGEITMRLLNACLLCPPIPKAALTG
jgi:hypothetical protein